MGMVLYEEQTVARGFSNVIILNLGKLRYRVDLGPLPLVLGNGNWGGGAGEPSQRTRPWPSSADAEGLGIGLSLRGLSFRGWKMSLLT